VTRMAEQEASKYGFRWGAVDVVRAATHKGYRFLLIETERQAVQIAITPTGFLRVGKPHKNRRSA
jgi:hypothetical protein